MKSIFCLALSLVLAQSLGAQASIATCSPANFDKERCLRVDGADYRLCSTEKINHRDCLVVIDRRVPVTWPTIQMSGGTKVVIAVEHPMGFESLSLDWTGFSALPGTDQIASVLPLAIPQLKGFAASSVTVPLQQLELPSISTSGFEAESEENIAKTRDLDLMKTIQDQLASMDSLLKAADDALAVDSTNIDHPTLYTKVRAVYEQLNQATAPIPKPGSGGPQNYAPPLHAPQTPNPWTDYDVWRIVLLCEMAGGFGNEVSCSASSAPPPPAFINVLSDIAILQAQLPSTPPAMPPANPLFDQTKFDSLASDIKREISKLAWPPDQDAVKTLLAQRFGAENTLISRLTVLSGTLTNVQKDFTTYYQNILFAVDAVPPIHTAAGDKAFTIVGTIYDPGLWKKGSPGPYPWFLGRQVAYSVNAVNDIATSQVSVTPGTAKTLLSTVTVLYANPRLETSAGAVVSFVHNRTFANETISNPPAGSPYTNGEVVIMQTKTDPELVPMVAVHWRVLPEFLMPGGRRGAIYGTIWAGLNPYSDVPEYGAGPTISWRSLMVSFLYNRAHQTSLVPPQRVNEPVCMPAANSNPPACATTPAEPVTQTTPLNAFAIGLSIRVPTSFASGTGGVSR